MKIVVSADWHLNKSNRMPDMVRSIQSIVDYCGWCHAEHLVIVGDLYATSSPSNSERAEVHKLLTKARGFGTKVTIVLGNHDIAVADIAGADHAANEYVNLSVPDIRVVSKPGAVDFGNISAVCIPHLTKEYMAGKLYADSWADAYKTLVSSANHHVPLVFSHVLVHGYADGAGTSERSIPKAIVPDDVHMCIFGDIHQPNDLYVGSPDRVSFNEASDAKRFIVLDVADTGERPVVSRTSVAIHTRNFQRIKFELAGDRTVVRLRGAAEGDIEIEPGMPVPAFVSEVISGLSDSIKDSVVWVTVSGHTAELAGINRAKVTELIKEAKPYKIHGITLTATDTTTVRDASFAAEKSDEELFKSWVGKQKYTEEVKNLVLKLGCELLQGGI